MTTPSLPNYATPATPLTPVFRAVLRPIQAFFRLEAAGGILLLACAVLALIWANLTNVTSYRAVFEYTFTLGFGPAIARFTLHQLINDGLMTIFFFLVGMEIKRELISGELRTLSQAALPIIAALGGMIAPAAVYFAFNGGGTGRMGWGIPMATDIAFCLGVLTLLKRHVPHALVVFVMALAIFDDIGGILVIALFYGHGLHTGWLLAAGAVTALLFAMGRCALARHGAAYALAGAALWWALHHAGVHATLAGVALGLAIPARPHQRSHATLGALALHVSTLARAPDDEELDGEALLSIEEHLKSLASPLERFIHTLHPWVAFGIMPLFALANTGVELRGIEVSQLTGPIAVGTAVALLLGKMTGIFAFASLAVKLRLATMPGRASPVKLLGVSLVAGIGFTVALFIASLAFPERPELLDEAKVGILAGSLVSGLVGALTLRLTPASPDADPA